MWDQMFKRDRPEPSPIGSRENAYVVAPDDWEESGVPYGSFCRCGKCGLVARSTHTFDFYADAAGIPLKCETCQMGQASNFSQETDKIAERILRYDLLDSIQEEMAESIATWVTVQIDANTCRSRYTTARDGDMVRIRDSVTGQEFVLMPIEECPPVSGEVCTDVSSFGNEVFGIKDWLE